MERRALSIPEIAIIAGTRAALGAGIGLLVADQLSDERRKGIGWALLSVGLLSTIPIVAQLAFGNGHRLCGGRVAELPGEEGFGGVGGVARG
jgi:hypothetical protein